MRWRVVVLVLGACTASPARSPSPGSVDPRTAYVLVDDLVAARRHDDPAERDRAERAVRAAWIGKRYRWEVRVVPELCHETSCLVAPFDHASGRLAEPQGWLPEVELEAPDAARLSAECGAGSRCVVRFEGRLARLTIGGDEATAVAFDEARIAGIRDERSGESWLTSPASH